MRLLDKLIGVVACGKDRPHPRAAEKIESASRRVTERAGPDGPDGQGCHADTPRRRCDVRDDVAMCDDDALRSPVVRNVNNCGHRIRVKVNQNVPDPAVGKSTPRMLRMRHIFMAAGISGIRKPSPSRSAAQRLS